MIELRKGCADDASALASLIFSSAPVLLPYLFSNTAEALTYISSAAKLNDGQYSACRHHLAVSSGKHRATRLPAETVVGCITLWHKALSDEYHRATLNSLTQFLSQQQIQHLITINPILSEVFSSPTESEIIIGHLAVNETTRGLGIGQKLVDYAKQQARIFRKSSVVLDVDANNETALRFYTACNFLQTKETIFLPTQQCFIRMQYTL